MYDTMRIREDLDYCQEALDNLKKGKRGNSFTAAELNRFLLDIEYKIQKNIKEYNKKKNNLQGKFLSKLRRTVIDKKIYVHEEYQYEVTQMKKELEYYMPKTPR